MVNSDTESPASTDCQCTGKCSGFECIKHRSAALVDINRPEEALLLLKNALRRTSSDERLRDQLRSVYQVIVNTSKQQKNKPADAEQSASDSTIENTRSPILTPPSTPRARSSKRRRVQDSNLVTSLKESFDCAICSKLLFEPVTTPCGHTFCRGCLSRAVDFTDSCPMCRNVLHLEDPSAIPITNILRNTIQQCFPAEYEERKREMEAVTVTPEDAMNRLPLFPLNAVVFPMQRFPMHIFEPRYRLMLRRIMQGSRKFGLISLKRTPEGGSELAKVGCILEVTKANRFPDGRSLIETVARERFKLLQRSEQDGYLVGSTELYNDEEDSDVEEANSIEERVRSIVNRLIERGSRLPTMQHALQRAGTVPAESQGGSALGMWLAGMLVSDDNERQKMLEMQSSTRRLEEVVSILERFRASMQARADANGEGRDCCIQ